MSAASLLILDSPQHLWIAVWKPPHLQTWCIYMCQIFHLHSAANPFEREGYYPACQSNTAGEQIYSVDMYLWTWREEKKNSPGGKKQRGFAVNSSVQITGTNRSHTCKNSQWHTCMNDHPTVFIWRVVDSSMCALHILPYSLKETFSYHSGFNKVIYCNFPSINYLQEK